LQQGQDQAAKGMPTSAAQQAQPQQPQQPQQTNQQQTATNNLK
jgi:hypothetical protein